MKHIALAALIFLAIAPSATSQSLSDAAITQAIKEGQAKKYTSVGIDAGPYSIVISGPSARVVAAARKAAEELKPFAAADVTTEMTGAFVRITAWPDKPSYAQYSGWTVTPAATNIILMPKGFKDLASAIQPASTEPFPQEWGNAMGAKFEGQGITADFDLSALPAGEFDVVVGCKCAREARGTVKLKDRGKIK